VFAVVVVVVVTAVVELLAGNLGRHNYGNQKFHATHAHQRVKNPLHRKAPRWAPIKLYAHAQAE